jgi:hypothetical protein
MGKAVKLPKTKCCVSTPRCDRCPVRMLKEGTLPPGYGVRRRTLVRLDGKKAKKVKKDELAATLRALKTATKSKKQRSGKKGFAA